MITIISYCNLKFCFYLIYYDHSQWNDMRNQQYIFWLLHIRIDLDALHTRLLLLHSYIVPMNKLCTDACACVQQIRIFKIHKIHNAHFEMYFLSLYYNVPRCYDTKASFSKQKQLLLCNLVMNQIILVLSINSKNDFSRHRKSSASVWLLQPEKSIWIQDAK